MEINIQQEISNIILEGNLSKQSRFLKTWRERWFVLTTNALFTFKERREYKNPTEAIPLKAITSVRSCSNEQVEQPNAFKIVTNDGTFYVLAESEKEKEQWIGQLGKTMIKLSQKNDEQD